MPISAADGTNVDVLEKLFLQHLPEGEPLYPPDYLTDQPERFFVAEIVREQVLQLTHDELPFSTAVVVDQFEEPGEDGLIELYCTILVERESQKPIVVGKGGRDDQGDRHGGARGARSFFDARVYLDLHVKVKSEWRDDERCSTSWACTAAAGELDGAVVYGRRSPRPHRRVRDDCRRVGSIASVVSRATLSRL